MLPSRFLFYIITTSIFLLILSSLFLLEFSNTSTISTKVLKLILVNNTSVYLKPSAKNEQAEVSSLPSMTSQIEHKVRLEGQGEGFNFTDSGRNFISRKRQRKGACDPDQVLLKVFMYDLPPDFHFGLLGWKGYAGETWPNVQDPAQIPTYPGGLNLQHSIEYWLTLDLLSSETLDIDRPCTAIRVNNSSLADIIFVPFFSSLSYNRHSKLHGKDKISVNRMLQSKLVRYLTGRDEWKQMGGKNHIIVAHHPNSMLDARKKLGSAMFVLADFGRYPAEIANLEKDIIAPYKHVVRTIRGDASAPFSKRPILAYFQGAVYRKDGGAIRQELYYLLKDEKGVHFAFGSVQGNGIHKAGQGMASSKFCLNIAGDTPSSNRLFDAIVNHCVPVIISDEIELPFEDVLDYSEFCLFVRAADAVKKGYLVNLLRGIKENKWTKMWERLKEVAQHFEFQYPSRPDDAVDMIWQAVSRKISSGRIKLHRENRYRRSRLFKGN